MFFPFLFLSFLSLSLHVSVSLSPFLPLTCFCLSLTLSLCLYLYVHLSFSLFINIGIFNIGEFPEKSPIANINSSPINCLVRYITILYETLSDSKTLFLHINSLPYFASIVSWYYLFLSLCLSVCLAINYCLSLSLLWAWNCH